ncbi:MAG: hypothetical protein P1U56_17795 [Saprospiraceae bacterium]|nr:hypothetical protein [Saprospiraceae bacterium]
MKNKIILELVWWIATAVIVILFLLPVMNYIGDKYDFYTPNVFFITLFITLTRYIFLLRHTFFAENKIIKLIFIFLPIPLFFYSVDALFNFQDFVDKGGHIEMLNHLQPDTAMDISKYIKYQFIFFGTGALIVIFLFPIRMIISIWRGINKGTI